MSLYEAYFVPNNVDPFGLAKACCKFSKGPGQPSFAEEVDCPAGSSSFNCCRKRAEGWFSVWVVVDNVSGACDRKRNDGNVLCGALRVAGGACVWAAPKPDPFAEEIPAACVLAGACVVAGAAYMCGSRPYRSVFPDLRKALDPPPPLPCFCCCFFPFTLAPALIGLSDPTSCQSQPGCFCSLKPDCSEPTNAPVGLPPRPPTPSLPEYGIGT